MIRIVHPRIRICYQSRILDPGVKKAPDPGSATLVIRYEANSIRRLEQEKKRLEEEKRRLLEDKRKREQEAREKGEASKVLYDSNFLLLTSMHHGFQKPKIIIMRFLLCNISMKTIQCTEKLMSRKLI
jgi:hypothetical protein